MKKALTTLLIVLCFYESELFSQEYSFKLKQLTQHEWEMKEYPIDKMAEALIIYDYGKTKFQYSDTEGFMIVFERQTKIKVLTEAGIKYSEISIPFYQGKNTIEKIDNIEACTYNLEDGIKTITTLDIKQVYKEKIGDNYYAIKFALPAVKPGSVIEYKYTLTTPRIFFLKDWNFQSQIPTLYSEYEIRMIPFYEYTWLLQGAKKFDSYSETLDDNLPHYFGPVKYYDNILKYVMKNIPAFRDEEYITSNEDYIMKLDFQLSAWSDIYGVKIKVITTWPELCKELNSSTEFGKYIKASGKHSESEFNYDLISGLSEKEKFASIISYVKSNFNWNGNNDYFASKTVGKFNKEKTGNSADINLFLCGMLQQAGFNAKPVILSTREHGKIKKDLPFVSFFDYVLVLVTIDGVKQLADATESFLDDDLVPQRCLNDEGLIVQKDIVEWVVLASKNLSVLSYVCTTNFSDNPDSLKVNIKLNASKYQASRLKKIYAGNYENAEKYFETKNFTPIDSIYFVNYSQTNVNFIMGCNAQYPTEYINGKYYLDPFLGIPIKENLFNQSKRYYPVDMEFPKGYSFYSEIKIPEGYKVEYIPKDYTVDGMLINIGYQVKTTDKNTIQISGNYTFKKAVYEAVDYNKLKLFCEEIIKKFNEKIVLVRE